STESFVFAGPKTYPELTAYAGRKGSGINGFAFGWDLNSAQAPLFNSPPLSGGELKRGRSPRLLDRVAFGYQQPLNIDISAVVSGLRMRLRDRPDTVNYRPEEETLFYSSTKVNADLKLNAHKWSLAGARETGPFWLGMALTRTDVEIDAVGAIRTDGILSINSMSDTYYAFNDPNDPWVNDYFNSLSAHLSGLSWGLNLGLTNRPGNGFLLGLNINLQNRIELTGPVEIEEHRFPALNINAPAGEDKFDVNRIQFANQSTQTYERAVQVSGTPGINMPQSVSVAASWSGLLKPTIQFTKYFGELSYEITLVEDSVQTTYSRGLKSDWSALLGLDFWFLQLAIGGVVVQDVVKGYHDASGIPVKVMAPTIVPIIRLGFEKSLPNNLTLGVLVAGLPEDALRLTLTYRIN
ncbi:MAG: hypothetical protein V2A61_04205, partial [Calditrichota bacterium]